MMNIGADALKLLATSHGVTGRLRASINGSPFTYPVQMLEGSVEVSGNSQIRRKLSCTIRADLDSPECDVFRTEYRAEYGIIRHNGETIWIPQGVFVIDDAQEAGRKQIKITGKDRWLRVQNARFLQPVTTKGKHLDAMVDMLRGADPRIAVNNLSKATATHNTSVWERDRDKAITEMAKSIGADVYFNQLGQAEIKDQVDIGTGVPDWIVGGGDGGVLLQSQRQRKQGNTYNAMVVEGETAEGTPSVRSVAYVKDPKSPVYFGGAFAQRPKFFRSSMITTQAQADASAASMLQKAIGIAKILDVSTLPHPGLDAGDIINVEAAEGVWERHVVDAFTLPLGPGEISISTRTPSDDAEEGTE